MKIIHITEAMGGGVAHSLSQLAIAQMAEGHDVMVVHSVRPDTPVHLLSALYPRPIRLKQLLMVTEISLFSDLMAFLRVFGLLLRERPDVIHLHSSKAGVLGRLAACLLRKSDHVFYSPRGFSFLREDVSPLKRELFLYFERIAGKLGGSIVGCSKSEFDLAISKVRRSRIYLVENSVDLSAVPNSKGSAGNFISVITSGRICYQKAPWRFRSLIEGCTDLPVKFTWLGEGELQNDLMLNGRFPSNLEISGWLSRAGVYQALTSADIFALPSLWEGMPLALIEAQAAGIPAVVSDVVGNRDVVIDGETGFICNSDSELIEKTRLLVEDSLLRKQMGLAAQKMAQKRFSVSRMHQEMMTVYRTSIVGFDK